MDIGEIKDLMNHLEASKLGKLVLKKGDFELHLEKETTPRAIAVPVTQESHPFTPESVPIGAAGRAEASGTYVTSPMVGTYYGAPGPDLPPFVKVGDRVNEKTVVCIVEAMKVMNEVKAGVSGIVAEICIDNSQPVEFGTRILRIRE